MSYTLNTFLIFQHQEFSFLLKERVCPLVIKLFSPNIKFRQGSSTSSSPAPVEKPYFPICMRLLRVVSVLIKQFYSLLVRMQFFYQSFCTRVLKECHFHMNLSSLKISFRSPASGGMFRSEAGRDQWKGLAFGSILSIVPRGVHEVPSLLASSLPFS